MQGFYEHSVSGGGNNNGGSSSSINNQAFSASTGLPASYLGFIGNQDNLNSSQNEKTWLNNSLTEKNWLNNSLSLPPEQRYHALNEMVGKIIEEENQKNLLASSNNFNYSFKSIAVHQTQPQSPPKYQTNSIPFYRQDSRTSLNESFNQNLIPPQYFAQFSRQHSIAENNNNISNSNKNRPKLTESETNNATKLSQESTSSEISPANQTFLFPQQQPQHFPNYPIFFPSAQPMLINGEMPANFFLMNNPIYTIQPFTLNKNTGQYFEYQSPTFVQSYDPINRLLNHAELQSGDQKQQQQIENVNTSSSNIGQLAFPASYSHHLATLSLDQHNYLLQQQRQLVLSLAANEQYVQARPFIMSQPGSILNPTESNSSPKNERFLKNNFPIAQTPTSPTSSLIRTHSSNSSNGSVNSPTFIRPPAFKPDISIEPGLNKTSFAHQEQSQTNSNKIYQRTFQEASPILHSNSMKEISVHFKNDLNETPSIEQADEKFRYFPKQSYRHHRTNSIKIQQSRTGPANELHVRLEECLHEFRCLESERKKIESELSYLSMSRRHSMGLNTPVPRLPLNPSRVDRLIVDALREYIKTLTFMAKIENLADTIFYSNMQANFKKWYERIQSVQVRRKEELVNSANKQRMSQNSRTNDDKDVLVLANAIRDLTQVTRKARTSLWCAFQISNVNYKNPIVLTKDLRHNESIFNSVTKTKEFVQRTFQIKTDLFEMN